ncbi:hypothetical protein BEH_07715 [Priestia filamentosa]|uniref:Uncharacterized protein n=1 Tax=Priestia filamentosa TaxID=1402861 RepID=A0A0H4KGQ8_9BACI|nr:hypothetical protein [Priestia filamentosa]AKO91996.1 hypothetical protein BEH_07715 [Priestia filamentosa]
MKTPEQLIQEDKVAFYGSFISSMVYINEAVTEAIEEMVAVGYVSVESESMVQRIEAFADLLGYELEVMPDADSDDYWYDVEVVNWQVKS